MINKQNGENFAIFYRGTIILLGGVLFFYTLSNAKGVLIPIFFSILFALLLFPLERRFEKWKFPRPLAIILTLIIILFSVLLLIYLISSQLVSFIDDIPALLNKLYDTMMRWQEKVKQIFNIEFTGDMQLLRKNFIESVSVNSIISGSLNTATNMISGLVIVPIYVFLFLFYRDMFRKFLFKISPQDQKDNIRQIFFKIQDVAFNYISGLMIVILIIAIMNSLGLWLVGVPYAVFFGVLAALLTVIPYFGVIMGALLPLTVAFLVGDSIWMPLGVIIVFSIVQFVEGNFITPKIVGGKVHLNPLAAIIALIIGGHLWGAAGMILFIPFIAILKVILDTFEPLEPFGYLLGTYSGPRKNMNWDYNKYIKQHIKDKNKEEL